MMKYVYIIVWMGLSIAEVCIGSIGAKETYIGASILLAAEMIAEMIESNKT